MAGAKSTASLCKHGSCGRPVYCRGWCRTHYDRQWRGDDMDAPFKVKKDGPDQCKIEGCERLLVPPYGRGMCSLHYHRWQRHGNPLYERSRSVCKVPDCNLYVTGNGWCSKHYTRERRHGNPTARLRGEVVDGKRICARCGKDTPLADMWVSNCRTCGLKIAAEYRAAHPIPLKRDLKCTCRICGKTFMGNSKNCVTCSEKCRKKNSSLLDAISHDKRRVRLLGCETEKIDRIRVFQRDGWICGLCGEPVDPNANKKDPMRASLDHIIPVSLGGSHTWGNVQLAHLRCNSSKGNRV